MRKTKIFAIIALASIFASTFAQAQRPDTRYMSCAQAVSLVNARGAIVLSTSQYKYAKYVRNHAYCPVNTAIKRAWVPTSDNRRCKIGFTCSESLGLFD